MSRYVDIEPIIASHTSTDCTVSDISFAEALYAPSIDIVRCKECKGLRKHQLMLNDELYITSYWCERVYPNIQIPTDQVGKHFCSFGERKESE